MLLLELQILAAAGRKPCCPWHSPVILAADGQRVGARGGWPNTQMSSEHPSIPSEAEESKSAVGSHGAIHATRPRIEARCFATAWP